MKFNQKLKRKKSKSNRRLRYFKNFCKMKFFVSNCKIFKITSIQKLMRTSFNKT